MDFADRLSARLEQLVRSRMQRPVQPAPPAEPDLAPQTHGPVLYYTKAVIDHATQPRNLGEMSAAEASGHAHIGDPGCGDEMDLWIRVEANRIVDVKWRSTGCAGALATSSMTTVLACGRTVPEALTLTDDDVIAALGGTPGNERHCVLLGTTALQAAIADYLARAESPGAAPTGRTNT